MFNDYEMLECASCQPGSFGDEVDLTMCPGRPLHQHRATDSVQRVSGRFLHRLEDRRMSAVLTGNLHQPVDDRMLAV